METTNTTAVSANIISDLSIENAVFLADAQRRRMVNRTFPYPQMCAMDRYAQLVYRLNITDLGKKYEETVGSKLKGTCTVNTSLKTLLSARYPGKQYETDIEAAAYRYEKQSAFYGQHFNVFASFMGIGTAMNYVGFGAATGSMPFAEAAFGLCFQVTTAGFQLSNMIGFRYRFSNQLNPEKGHTATAKVAVGQLFAPRTIEQWKDLRYTFSGGVANIGGALNAAASMGMAFAMLDYSLSKGDLTKVAYYACQSVIALSSMTSNSLKAAALYGRVNKPLVGAVAKGTAGKLSVAGSSFSVFQSLAATASLSVFLASPNLSESQKGAIGAEMAQQVAGAVALLAVDEYLAKLTLSLVKSTGRMLGAGIGTMVAALMVCLSPIQIKSLIDQSSYADSLAEVGAEMAALGYEGDSLMASFYRDKTSAEAGILAAQNILSLIGAAVSLAAAISGVGAPIGLIASAAAGMLSGILGAVQQPIIDKIAMEFAAKINEQGGSYAYFAKNVSAQYQQFIASADARDTLIDLEHAFGVNSVVGVTTIPLSKTALEMAAITYNAACLTTAQATIDRFVAGKVQADKTLAIAPEKGNIVVGGDAGTKQLVTFLTPLMAPGTEQRVRVQTGKDAYYTSLQVLFNGPGWSVEDGAASTTVDARKIVTRLFKDDGKTLQKEIALKVSGGAGDDTLLANSGCITFDGGSGENSISYLGLNTSDSRTGVVVTATATGFTVQKTLFDYRAYQEVTKSQDYQRGKEKETVEYRDFVLTTIKGNGVVVTDTLTNVQDITGSAYNDRIIGNDQRNIIRGGTGSNYGASDYVNAAGGNDIIIGDGAGFDTLIGGEGFDVLDYSVAEGYETVEGASTTHFGAGDLRRRWQRFDDGRFRQRYPVRRGRQRHPQRGLR